MAKLSITDEQRARLRANAMQAQAASMPFSQWKDGEFKMGGEVITGAQFLAVVDQTSSVWNAFFKHHVEELVRVKWKDEGKHPPKPNVHADPNQWELDYQNNPKDPRTLQYELPLVEAEDGGRVIMFKASTKMAKEAVGRLVEQCTVNGEVQRPYVTLTAAQAPDGKGFMPEFVIDEFSDDVGPIALPGDEPSSKPADTSLSNRPNTGHKPAPAVDDQIPF